MKFLKMLNIIIYILMVCFSGLLSQEVFAGAWVPKKGEGYMKLGFSDYKATDFFGKNKGFREFKGQNTSYYGEHGLGNNLAIYGTVLYQEIEQTNAAQGRSTNSGLGDAELGLRLQLRTDPAVVAVSFLMKLPYFYDDNEELPLGNGQIDYETRLLIGKSLNQYGYFGVELGYRLRRDNPSDEFRYLLEYGFSATAHLYFRTKLDGTKSIGNADTIGSSNFSNTPEFDLGKLEVTTGWNLGKKNNSGSQWGIEATYNKDLYGDTSLKGDGFQLAITRVY